jgi:hypothetical protein
MRFTESTYLPQPNPYAIAERDRAQGPVAFR